MTPTSTAARLLAAVVTLIAAGGALAAPVTYQVDPHHTFPSFEADHMGISVWRGKLNKSSGTVKFDKATGSGSIDIAVDLSSIDFGHDPLNAWARSAQFSTSRSTRRRSTRVASTARPRAFRRRCSAS